jgi:GNAT superfamily N-acetyltransferase
METTQFVTSPDFESMSDLEIAHFVQANIGEFGDYEITAQEILERPIAIERWAHGFAIIINPGTYDVGLWWMYVRKECRGKGLGRKYMKQILRKYGSEWRMTLHCHKRLRPFYSSFGFRVYKRDGDSRRMMMKEWD